MKTITDYTIYCTEEQTRKALELGAPIIWHKNAYIRKEVPSFREPLDNGEWLLYICPTAEQMIGFLRSRGMRFYFNDITTLWQIVANEKIIAQGCSEQKELAAIDAALDYLSKNKK